MSKYKVPTIKAMVEAGVHFGHRTRRWHPTMEKYIYTVKNGVHIIDLEITEQKLQEACTFLYETTKKGGTVVFVGTKKQAIEIVKTAAKDCGAMYVTDRWIGGALTNIRTIRKNIDKLLDLMSRRDSGDLEIYTKKERLLIDRDIEKLLKSYGGITQLKKPPQALVVIDAKREKTAIQEATKLKIPVVALLDTNTDPTLVSYPIPGNDDAIKSIMVVVNAMAGAIKEGYEDYAKSEAAKKAEETEAKKKLEVSEKAADSKTKDKKVETPVKDKKEAKKAEVKKEAPQKETKAKSKDETKIDKLRTQLNDLKKKRDDVILARGKAAEENKDLRENAAFDQLDQDERNLAAQINMLMKEISGLADAGKSKKEAVKKPAKKSAAKKAPAKKEPSSKKVKKENKK